MYNRLVPHEAKAELVALRQRRLVPLRKEVAEGTDVNYQHQLFSSFAGFLPYLTKPTLWIF